MVVLKSRDTSPSPDFGLLITILRVEDAGSLIYAIDDVSLAARPAIHGHSSSIRRKGELLNFEAKDFAPAKACVFEENKREKQLIPLKKIKGVGTVIGYQSSSLSAWLLKRRVLGCVRSKICRIGSGGLRIQDYAVCLDLCRDHFNRNLMLCIFSC